MKFGIVKSLLVPAMLVLAFWCPAAEAGWMSSFSGNTPFVGHNRADGTVSFAVYDNTDGGSWISELSPGTVTDFLGTSDGTEKYVYFYQVVNEDPASPDNPLVVFAGEESTHDSIGYVSDRIFLEGPNAVKYGNALNDNYASPGFTSLADARNPAYTNYDLGVVEFWWTTTGDGTIPTSGSNRTSSVVFITSDFGPVWTEGAIGTGTYGASGDIPTPAPVPAPTSLVGLLSMIPLLGIGLARWRRR